MSATVETVLWTIEIVCTDRGQHPRVWMTRMRLDKWSDGHESWSSPVPLTAARSKTDLKHMPYGPPDPNAEPGAAVSRDAYGFACPRCSRWPRISRERWIKLMDGARRGAVAEFDVSYLD